MDYVQKQYNVRVRYSDQPMLIVVDRLSGKETCLIPELCRMTGLTDGIRKNFNLMREIAKYTHTGASDKLYECRKLFQAIKNKPLCSKIMNDWNVNISYDPAKMSGLRLKPGNLLMGRQPIPLEGARDLERKIQGEMVKQGKLDNWMILYEKRNGERAFRAFQSDFEKCLRDARFDYREPREVAIQPYGKFCNARDWQEAIRNAYERYHPQLVILILPGSKASERLYNDVKRYCLESAPVVSQVVLQGTIERGKNLRSIASKILIQVCAKLGGVPWVMDSMPWIKEKPTMIVGMDVFHKTASSKESVMGVCASINDSATKFVSHAEVHDVGRELVT